MDVFEAVAEPSRRALLDALIDGEHTAGELVATLPGLTQPTVSRHLRVLREVGLVEVRPDAQRRIYALAPTGWSRSTPGSTAIAATGPITWTPSSGTWKRPEESQMSEPHGRLAIDGDQAVLKFERRLPFPIDSVWSAITDPTNASSGSARPIDAARAGRST